MHEHGHGGVEDNEHDQARKAADGVRAAYVARIPEAGEALRASEHMTDARAHLRRAAFDLLTPNAPSSSFDSFVRDRVDHETALFFGELLGKRNDLADGAGGTQR